MGEMPESIRKAFDDIRTEILSGGHAGDKLAAQSHALRELAKYLYETGVSVSRFTRETQEVLVAVALNGDY